MKSDQDERDVGVVSLVEELDLLDRQIEKRQIVPDHDRRLRASATHRSAQTSVQFNHDQLLKQITSLYHQVYNVGREVLGSFWYILLIGLIGGCEKI